MPPLSDQREILENLNLLAVRDVNDLWRGATAMDLSSNEFRETIVTATPEVLTPYASTAADLSAQWYDDAAPELPYRAAPAAIAATEQIAASTSWALYATGQLALGRLAGLAQRTIFNANRATIIDNAKRETGATWARHASATACAFCRMLATRGAVYSSKGASVSADGGGRYHDHCHCMAVMVRPGATYEPPAYVEEWEKEYRDAVGATPKLGDHGAIDTKAVLAHMRAGETSSKAAPNPKAATGGAKPPIKPPTGGQAVSGAADDRSWRVPDDQVPEAYPKLVRGDGQVHFSPRDRPDVETKREHIIRGDKNGGGHGDGAGMGKSEFTGWTEEQVMAAVDLALAAPYSVTREGSTLYFRRLVDGTPVEARVAARKPTPTLRTAYPNWDALKTIAKGEGELLWGA